MTTSAATATQTIEYSDGDATEMRLLEVLTACHDVSCTSAELHGHIADWPSEYHLSAARHHLLRPFSFSPADRILELGCGCGALTRYLGETGARVVAIEGSARRATIAQERCRDLPNVSIHCANLMDYRSDERFDCVTLIGVLEYAPIYIDAANPVLACLQHARSFLKENGTLILAIENQLGLKYFNGCSEDHLGIAYFGINDLYGKTDPVTFGRQALIEKLAEAGFSACEFFYPFPDYKLPGAILSEAALLDERLNVADLLAAHPGRDYPETHQRAFAENLAWRAVLRNRLLPDLANSFLVFACAEQSRRAGPDWLAKLYGHRNRRTCYQVETTIATDHTGGLTTRKRKLFPADQGPASAWLEHAIVNEEFQGGSLLVGKVHAAMAREADVAGLISCLKPWLDFLSAYVRPDAEGRQVLPENFVDCTPTNLLVSPVGKMHYFDAEWISPEPVPLAWVVIRGIFNSLNGCMENRRLASFSYRQLIVEIAGSSSISLTEDDFLLADSLEKRLSEQCMQPDPARKSLAGMLDAPLCGVLRIAGHIPELSRRVTALERELARVKSTFSWQITKPLRLLAFLWRKIVGHGHRS